MENWEKKILIIEDEQHQREALRTAFEKKGCTVEVALNGKDGLEKLRVFVPNIILLDLLMPVVDGFAFLEAIRNDESLKSIPVIILTNLAERQRIALLMNPEKDFFFTKTNSALKDIISKAREVCSKTDC